MGDVFLGNAGQLKILHVISGRFFGGGQRVVLDLLGALPKVDEIDLRLCALGRSHDSPLMPRADMIVDYDGQYNHPMTLYRSVNGLRKVIREFEPDILHTHGLDADLIGSLTVNGKRTKQLCHLHITPPIGQRQSVKSAIRRKLFQVLTSRNKARFIAVSDAVRQQMSSYYQIAIDRIVTVRNGVVLSDFTEVGEPPSYRVDCNGHASGKVTFGTAGRLAPMKGFEFLIEAMARLKHSRQGGRLVIAGTGSDRIRLEEKAASLGLNEDVEFLGQVANMPEFYNSIDVFVLPSISTEGLPLVLLEAMAMGKPVLATNLAGAPEVIQSGRNGVLVDPANSEALALAMAELLDSPVKREEIGQSGKNVVLEAFSIDRVAQEVVQVYRQMCEKAGRR